MKQSDAFFKTEGDRWLERNPHIGDKDPVCEAIVALGISPKSVMEIGCSDGWRLAALRDKFGCDIFGVEPSLNAALEAAKRRVPVFRSTAELLPAEEDCFDLVIYGFCLYLTDPEDWFSIVTEGSRVLSDGGHLIIYDFPTEDGMPFARAYAHREGVLSYHMDFSKLWNCHPWFQTVARVGGVTVLRKDTGAIRVKS